VVVEHVTALRVLAVDPLGATAEERAQLLPFQRSARTVSTPEVVLFPTAMHRLVLEGSQPMPYR
jgi:hypothetical protein